jgi:hypothetical protein
MDYFILINPLNAELNPICHLLASLEAHHILHVSRIRVKLTVARFVGTGGFLIGYSNGYTK